MPKTGSGLLADADKVHAIRAALAGFGRDPSGLIPAFQAIQAKVGYLPPETFPIVAEQFNLPEARVFGVATFYAQFYLTRQGRHCVKVCRGTACHVRGSARIMAAVEKKLGVKAGRTTPDYKFSLERVACFGSCALAPVVVIDGKVHGRMTPSGAIKMIEGLE